MYEIGRVFRGLLYVCCMKVDFNHARVKGFLKSFVASRDCTTDYNLLTGADVIK
jgi:hypothetical protein